MLNYRVKATLKNYYADVILQTWFVIRKYSLLQTVARKLGISASE